jgi:hypothetical protein
LPRAVAGPAAGVNAQKLQQQAAAMDERVGFSRWRARSVYFSFNQVILIFGILGVGLYMVGRIGGADLASAVILGTSTSPRCTSGRAFMSARPGAACQKPKAVLISGK